MNRELCLKYGVWDQVRVDHGNEFMLMLYLQHKIQDLRFNKNRLPFVQTTSRMVNIFIKIKHPSNIKKKIFLKNRVVERTWHEINQRVNYQIKELLVYYSINDMINIENTQLMSVVGNLNLDFLNFLV